MEMVKGQKKSEIHAKSGLYCIAFAFLTPIGRHNSAMETRHFLAFLMIIFVNGTTVFPIERFQLFVKYLGSRRMIKWSKHAFQFETCHLAVALHEAFFFAGIQIAFAAAGFSLHSFTHAFQQGLPRLLVNHRQTNRTCNKKGLQRASKVLCKKSSVCQGLGYPPCKVCTKWQLP